MTAFAALLGFTFWTLALVAGVFAYRGIRTLGGTAINAWGRGVRQSVDMPLIKRMEDAHANALENLPIFAVIVFAASAMGKLDLITPFCGYVLFARIGQSVTHLIGTSAPLVMVRATFWAVQLGLFFLMLCKLWG